MTKKTRLNLEKAIGELIESYVEFDKEKVMHLKVGLEAIHHAQKDHKPEEKANLYTVSDHEALHNLLEQHGIPRHEFEKVPKLLAVENTSKLESKPLKEAVERIITKTHSEQEVPTTGMVAVMFNMVSDKIKDALVASQAGQRTLSAIERATSISHLPAIKEAALRDTLYDYGNKHRLARPYIGEVGNEPDYLVSAKAVHHLADLFESSLTLLPAAREFESTEKSMEGFQKLAVCIFSQASLNLDMAQSRKAAKDIMKLAKHLGGKDPHAIETSDACQIVDAGMKYLRHSLRMEGIITEQEAQDYEKLVNKRIEQIRKMEMA